jgi:hypothetical protein
VGRLPSISLLYVDDKGDLTVDQVIELGMELARAVRGISGCKLFAIEYEGPAPNATLFVATTGALGEPAAEQGLRAPANYELCLLIAVVVALTTTAGFFAAKRQRGLRA